MTARTEPADKEDMNAYANAKSTKRKAARDRLLSHKTVKKGLLIVHTGTGKGKSTAAFGLVLRALGNGMRTGIIQFVKGKWETGERAVLEAFKDQITMKTMGEGFTWETCDRARDIEAANKAWSAAREMIEAARTSGAYDLILLDELNICLRYNYLDIDQVVETLSNRPPMLHIVVTGRNARESLIEAADLVTEMKLVKHPFREQNVCAQKGIEF